MRIVAGAFGLLLAIQAFAAGPPKAGSFVLANGMKVIVEEDHDIPNVAMYFFFRIGSRNERPGITGISHFFEHMMFNGAKKYGPKQFDTEMEKAGGRNNAYTSRDLTVYTDWFPRSALRLMFEMESDRIQNLAFDPKMIESERGVVASERRTNVDNSNFGLLYEQVNAAAYTAHPYGWPVVGWASDIAAWSMDDLKNHFRMGYAPNNCTVVIVGDVTSEEIARLAREFLEPIPKHDLPPAVRTIEPQQKGERRTTVLKAAQLPMQMISYHVPAASSADFLPLQVLDAILSQGRSSRLYARMVDKQPLAISVRQFMSPQIDPGTMIFTINPRAGVSTLDTEKALFEEIEKVRTVPVTGEELRKAKNLLLTDLFRDLKTISGRANMLGNYEVYWGDYAKLYTADKDIEAVTTADVLRVARSYLDPLNRTVGTLIPEKPAAAAEVSQ